MVLGLRKSSVLVFSVAASSLSPQPTSCSKLRTVLSLTIVCVCVWTNTHRSAHACVHTLMRWHRQDWLSRNSPEICLSSSFQADSIHHLQSVCSLISSYWSSLGRTERGQGIQPHLCLKVTCSQGSHILFLCVRQSSNPAQSSHQTQL